MRDVYVRAADDAELLSLNHEIALVDARITALLDALSSGESPHAWQNLTEQVDALVDAQRRSDPTAAATALSAVIRLVRQGAADSERWREVDHALHSRRKLVESERQRRVVMQQFVSADQQMALVTQLGMLVREHVTDQAALRAISEGLIRFITHVDTVVIEK